MKKLIMFILLFISFSVKASPSELIFFGDSLTDSGNLYQLFLKFFPKSPPYFKGRFSNGPVWAEYIGKHYYDQSYIDYKIYAVGGATAVWHRPSKHFVPFVLLKFEINKYLLDSYGQDRSNVLYTFWIGANDYLFMEQKNPEAEADHVVQGIVNQINNLIHHGARHFIVMNLPDLGKIPNLPNFYIAQKKEDLHRVTVLHNQKLERAITNIKNNYPNIEIFKIDIYALFKELYAHPDVYNKKYHVNITNQTESCWTGGYWLKNNVITKESIMNDLQLYFQNKQSLQNQQINIDDMAETILHTPELYQSYALSKASELGMKPCEHADQYVFWDKIHPTQVVHRVLAQILLEDFMKVSNYN